MRRLTFWYEFASTYSYLASLRIEELCAQADVDVVWRPFLLGPIFRAQGWDTSPFKIYEAKGAYMWRDMERLCEDMQIPFRRPDEFPLNGLLAARIATYGMKHGWGADFTKAVYSAEYGEGKRIDDETVLQGLLATMGLDAEAVFDGALEDENKAALRHATEEAIALGIFGAPTFTTQSGELFWGNDRLEQAIAWECEARS